jgi:hypothetical protein
LVTGLAAVFDLLGVEGSGRAVRAHTGSVLAQREVDDGLQGTEARHDDLFGHIAIDVPYAWEPVKDLHDDRSSLLGEDGGQALRSHQLRYQPDP